MMHRTGLAIVAMFSVLPGSAAGQGQGEVFGTVVLDSGDRGAALNTALQFSSALSADSIGIAACTLAKAVGHEDFQAELEPVLRGRLLDPKTQDGGEARCAVWEFQEEGTTRVYVEQMTEIRRGAPNGLLPYPERLAFEVRLQVLRGTSYREWHVITVRPLRFRDEEHGTRVESWRVIRYEVTGWQWMHDRSSSGGPVR